MIVATGLGVVAPTGIGTEEFWAATLDGKSAIDRISRFDPGSYQCQLGGEVRNFDPAAYMPGKLIPQTDRMTRFALAATAMALTDAAADPRQLRDYDMSVITANACGGVEFGQGQLERLWRDGPGNVAAYMAIAWFYAATTGQLSIQYGMRGPCCLVATEQAGGLDAVGQARRQLRRGDTRIAVTGGTDAPLAPAAHVATQTTGLLSRSLDAERAYLPFDSGAVGYVPGEGGAILILERLADARERGAERVYGEVAGYAATFDPPPGSSRPPSLRRAIELALADARTSPGEVDVVFADGYAERGLDRAEAAALASVFTPGGVPVTVPKTMTGRLYAGAGALDLVSALLALRDQVIPPTVHVTQPAPGCSLDLVLGAPREKAIRCALVLARGHGGFNAAVVLRAIA